MVEVTGLTKCYGKNTVVDHISFHLEPGQIYGLLGPNGAGKSTTMKLLTGCLFPTEGSISIAGHDLLQEPEAAKKCIGYLPEHPPLYSGMTPREYLRFMAEIKRLPHPGQLAEQMMERTHIACMGDRLIRHLSKGYTQRVGIAQALLGSPQLLILDEPMVGLDPTQIIEIRNLILELGRTHTVIFSSHILAEVQAICSRLLVISGGRLIADDTAEHLQALTQSQEILELTVSGSAQQLEAAFAGLEGLDRLEFLPAREGQCSALLYHARDAELQWEVLDRLRAAGCKLLQLGTRSNSLEDVFLSLLAQSEGETGPAGKE